MRKIKFRAWHTQLEDMTYSFNKHDKEPISKFFWHPMAHHDSNLYINW